MGETPSSTPFVCGLAVAHGVVVHPHTRRLHGLDHECGQGLFQRAYGVEPCRHQPGIQSDVVALQVGGFLDTIPFLRTGRGRCSVRTVAGWRTVGIPGRLGSMGRARCQRGAGGAREFLGSSHGEPGRSVGGDAQSRADCLGGYPLHPLLCQQFPYRPGAHLDFERLPGPAYGLDYEISRQVAVASGHLQVVAQ